MPAVNVFTYGSLMFDPVWNKVCLGRYKTQVAVLPDFQRYSVSNQTYPALVAEPGASVQGLVYLEVSEIDQQRLNQFEGAEYELGAATVGGIDIVFYRFIALDFLDRRLWSPAEFERNGLPSFLTRHVGNFLTHGTR
jgi:gamma-glutamylcyclotransferase (GGCT)/AIG2-like uncharacterized protein YtfP